MICLLWLAMPLLAVQASRNSLSPHTQKTGAGHLNALDNLERLRNMSPEDRARMLSGLTTEQQEKIEAGITRLEQMPPQRRAQLLERFRRFQSLSPAQKEAVREATRQLQELPEPRRKAVRQELNRWRNMTDAQRQQRFASPEFQGRFYPNERDIIEKESIVLPQTIKVQ